MNSSKTYQLSDSFNDFLIHVSEGFLSSEEFDKVFLRFESFSNKYHFDNSSESNLLRILSSLFDKKSFLLDSLKYEHHVEVVCAVSSLSNYLTDIIVRNPEYLYTLFNQEILLNQVNENELRNEIENSLSGFKSFASKTKMLRNFKRKYLLKIGTADILGFHDLQNTTQQLSILAKVLSSVLLDICYKEIHNKYSIQPITQFALCSLGKLGGNELNYSSDIDLILFYKENKELPEIKKSYHELITESVQLFIKEASAVTSESYLYRVDFRLRPDGRNSMLCRTIRDYLRYYETRGEDWERQMLIKLGFIAGSKDLFNEFKNYLEGFIYPKTLHSSVINTVQKMKKSIEMRLNDDRNIKLIPGGIRDIEFCTQVLQLMNGGKFPELRSSNTLEALSELLQRDLISSEEYDVLYKGYVLFRRIEHFAQLMNDTQTHLLPDSYDDKKKLASLLNFDSVEQLQNQVDEYRKNIRKIYDDIFGTAVDEEIDYYQEIKFNNNSKAKANIKYLAMGMGLIGDRQFDKATTKLFEEIEPNLIDFLKTAVDPDLVLENFVRVIKNATLKSVWYRTFTDKLFFNSFLNVCQFNQRAIDLMATSKKIADLFLSKQVFQPVKIDDAKASLTEIIFILSVQHSCGIIEYPEFSILLRRKIELEIKLAVNGVNEKYEFFIASLGSFANDEINFGSDIDLILVVDNLKKYQQVERDFQNLLNELRKRLNPFPVDCRLRPEGKSAQLVWDMDGYKKYINTRMRVWEFQALSKLRFIDGSINLFNKFIENLEVKVSELSKEIIIKEISDMVLKKNSISYPDRVKINLKTNSGALTEIDAIISSMLLINSDLYLKCIDTGCINKIDSIELKQTATDKNIFKENFIFIKNVQIGLQNLFNQNKSILPGDNEKIQLLASYLGYKDSEIFLNKLHSILNVNTILLRNLIG